uniref:Uncharacterized protein n=1 Tax=Arundo donax TaxID=35708 RepID=A0A0A9E4R7_ARUDO
MSSSDGSDLSILSNLQSVLSVLVPRM